MPRPSVLRTRIHGNEYRDSMILMALTARLLQQPGVHTAMAVMGQPADKQRLADAGLLSPDASGADSDSLIIALRAADDAHADAALTWADQFLAGRLERDRPAPATWQSCEAAARALPGATLALISVPGRHAAREARRALDLGLNVLLFSDHVTVADEIALKRLAAQRGLLVMGPDCGTAIVGGAALGFANTVRRGNIGIVGASGTGIQEVSVLLDRAGLGVSHALGTGGRDLSAEIGGLTTLQAIDLLAGDSHTDVLVVLSKASAPSLRDLVVERLRRWEKPAVVCLLGLTVDSDTGHIHFVRTLHAAATTAARLARASPAAVAPLQPELVDAVLQERHRLRAGQRFARGLFSGGSLAVEALVTWSGVLEPAWSNTPLDPQCALPDVRVSRRHTVIDFGTDVFTDGRPHPMIDPTDRQQRLLQEAADPEVGVVLLDVVTGYGAHPDMAGALAHTIREARRIAGRDGRHLPVVAHVCGTEADPQPLSVQERILAEAGALVAPSNAAAAQHAARIVGARGE